MPYVPSLYVYVVKNNKKQKTKQKIDKEIQAQ